MRMSFMVNRPEKEVGFRLRRVEAPAAPDVTTLGVVYLKHR